MRYFIVVFALLLFPASLSAKDDTPMQYTIFTQKPASLDMAKHMGHPVLTGFKSRNIIYTAKHHDVVQVAGYDDEPYLSFRFDVKPLPGVDITGLPALLPDSTEREKLKALIPPEWQRQRGALIFEGGYVFTPYLPPRAKPIGSTEWRYELRWYRVHGNYYFVTVNRGPEVIALEALMTASNGEDIVPILGESHENPSDCFFTSSWGGMTVGIYPDSCPGVSNAGVKLIQVHEEDLPEDFPKNLVRWIR